MYNKEKAKENYIKNRDKLNERAKQYYHDNKEARQKYNNEYWEEISINILNKGKKIENIKM